MNFVCSWKNSVWEAEIENRSSYSFTFLGKEEAPLAAWDQWRCAAVSAENLASLRQPAQFDARTRNGAPEEMDPCILLVERGDELVEQIRSYIECGFEEIYILNVSRNQVGIIDFMAREVLPAFR